MWLLTAGQNPPRLIRPYLEGKLSPRVRTVSCGGTSRVCTQHASKNISSSYSPCCWYLVVSPAVFCCYWLWFKTRCSDFISCCCRWIIFGRQQMAVKCLALFFVLSYGITFLRGHKLVLARLSCEPTWSPPPRSAVRHQCGLEAERRMEDKRRRRNGSGGGWDCDHQQEAARLPSGSAQRDTSQRLLHRPVVAYRSMLDSSCSS